MNKDIKTPSPWDMEATKPEATVEATTPETETKTNKTRRARVVEPEVVAPPVEQVEPLYDMEGLMTDFPTAKDLEKFVYDQTGYVLNLKGRSNKFKYQTAMDVLNGQKPDPILLGSENPYLDRNELVPEDPLKELPPRPAELAGLHEVTRFGTNTFPHPDPEWKAQDIKANVVFRKYDNGIITYEILGPIAKRPVGVKINKFGNKQPEKITWIDPRTGEQIIRRADGSYTPLGTRLKAFMQRQRVNKSNQWDVWIDRDFVAMDQMITDNPWGTN